MRPLLYAALMWAICLYALFKGGWAERVVALAILIGSILTPLMLPPMDQRFQHVEIAVVTIDIVVFLILFGVGLYSSGFWALWIAAMQGISLLGHFTPLMPVRMPYIYSNAITLWSWPMLLILGLATSLRHSRQKVENSSPR